MFTQLFKSKQSSTTTLAHDDFFNALRTKEYKRLDTYGHVYLDYTGGNLYAESQLKKHQELLSKNVFGNPHSTNPTSQLATSLVEKARKKVIDHFNADDYYCIFTQNASGALKIIGECYPFCEQGEFLLLADNHNSVNGIREYCKGNQAAFSYVPIRYEDLTIDHDVLKNALSQSGAKKHKLFAFPAQSNVSGVQHDLSWIKKAQEKGWDVLLDAAAYAPTSKLDLNKVTPNFVSISFYKIFGYPTGLGCLLVRKDSFDLLVKRWFAGGTVTLASVMSPHHYLAANHERFENGTINYLDIPALSIGLDHIQQIGIPRIQERVKSLSNYLYHQLNTLVHNNQTKKLNLFGPQDRKHVGGTLIMTFLTEHGETIPFEEVEQRANKEMISLRSGCFCNPGIDEVNNCLTTQELSQYFTSRITGDYSDMIATLKKIRGAIRVSVGLATTKQDLDRFIDFVKRL